MADENPVRVRVFVEANPTEDTVEFPRDQWNRMTPAERGTLLDEWVDRAISDAGGAGYQLLDPADEKDL